MSRISEKSQIPFRVGFGYDIHRMTSGKALILGGIRMKCAFALVGHSDADVLLHAICDALLGAAALGDIGKHFPNTDRRYRGISSIKLLTATARLVKNAGFTVVNVDSTVILEYPKIGVAARRMEKVIARTLKIPASSVSVKATTNERLGPLGRGEGCAAMAVSLLTRL